MALPPQYSEGFGGRYSGTANAGHIQVHTREDSSNSLEEMFRVVTDPSCSFSSAKPFKDRKLPRSFFEPSPQPVMPAHMSPPAGECNHFRSASGVAAPLDAGRATSARNHHQLLLGGCSDQPATAAASVAAVAMEIGQEAASAGPAGLPDAAAAAVSHTRAHSSPAKISNQQAAAAAAAAQMSQRHFGAGQGQSQCQDQGQGQGHGQGQCQSAGQGAAQFSFYHHHQQSNLMDTTMQGTFDDPGNRGCPEFEICPLPAGWEMAYNEENKIYFVDHNSKSTSWFDPRIPRQMQSGWGQSASEVCRLHLDYLGRCSAHRKLSSLSAQKDLLRRQLEAATRTEQIMRHEMFLMQGLAEGQSPLHQLGKLGDPTLQCGVEHQRQESSDSGLAPEPVITPPLLEITDSPQFNRMDTGDTSVDGLLSSLKDTDLLLAADFDMPTFRQDFQGSI